MDEDRRLWPEVMRRLRANAPGVCRQWFDELSPIGVMDGRYVVRAQSDAHRDYLRSTCAQHFSDATRDATGRLVTVRFVGPGDVLDESEQDADDAGPGRAAGDGERDRSPIDAVVEYKAAAASVMPKRDDVAREAELDRDPDWAGAPAREGEYHGRDALQGVGVPAPARGPAVGSTLVIDPDNSFDHFVVGPENRLAHAAAVAVAAKPGTAYNPYFVHGGVGLGKTHLLQAVCLRLVERNPDVTIHYISCEEFVTVFMEAVQGAQMAQFRDRFRHVDVLVIDDIHFLAKRDRSQEEFFHTFNALYQARKQIVLSSDAPPEEIPHLEDRLVSRFKWGLVTSVEPPCFETRVAIIQNKARLRGMEIADDVACAIAGQIDRNIRELEGAVTKIQVLAEVEDRPVDLELVREALHFPAEQPSRTIQLTTITEVVTEYYAVKGTDLQSKRRPRSITVPRQVCMYLARQLTDHSLEEIGGYYGGRDHTTVLHAVRAVEKRLGEDSHFAASVRTLEGKLHARD